MTLFNVLSMFLKKETLSKKPQEKINSLNNIRRHLKKYDLLNSKYLLKRNNTYFVLYLEKDRNIQYSLKTSNFLLANILKYKLLENIHKRIKEMKDEDLLKITNNFNRHLEIFKADTGVNIKVNDFDNIDNEKNS